MKTQNIKLYALFLCAACSFSSPKEPLAGRPIILNIEPPVITEEERASYEATFIRGASFSLEVPGAPTRKKMLKSSPPLEEEKKKPEVLYDCGAYPGTALSLPEKTSDVLEALVSFWHQDVRQNTERLDDVMELVPYLTDLDLTSLDPQEKIYLQNSLLHFAKKAPWRERTKLTTLAMRFAMTKGELEELGSSIDPTVSALLGPLDAWTERKGNYKKEILAHERQISEGLLYFRPVALPQKRALIAQMVAFDTEGEAHLTPFIAFIELREGFLADAPACVIEANLTQLRKGAPAALRAVEYQEFPVQDGCAFVSSTGDGGLGCRNCHSDKSAMSHLQDVPKEEAAAWLSTRQQDLLGFSEKTFSFVKGR